MKNLIPLAVILVSLANSPAMAQSYNTMAASQGNQSNTNNMLTGSQASQSYGLQGNTMVGRYGSYGVGMNPTMSAVQGLSSFSTAGISNGGLTYGFNGQGFNNFGATGGQYLPTASTGAVDLNIVENTNYQLYGGSGGLLQNVLPSIITGTTAAAAAAAAAVTNPTLTPGQSYNSLSNSFYGP